MHSVVRRSLALASSALSLALTLAPLSSPVHAADEPAAVHVVAVGETLSQIAADAGLDTAVLLKLNALDDPNLLFAGQALKLGAASTSGQAGRTNTIADGDTLPSAQSPAASAPAAPKGALVVSYTVQPGETLNQIARQFQVTADLIAQANNLDDPNRIRVGSVLKIPLPGHEHVVQAGETLRDIALSEKIDLGTLIDFNELDDPELIRIGQIVHVPTQPTQQAAAARATPSASAVDGAAAAPAPPPVSASAAPVPPAQPPAAASAPKPATATAPSTAAATPTPTKPTATPTSKPNAPAAPAVAAPPRSAPTDDLAGASLKLLGSPYVWGGSTPSGFDCSGFVWYVAKQVGRPLSRGMFGEYNSGSHPSRDELRPGDLVFFQNTYSPGLSHNGIYIGNNQFVHAADEAAGVTISSLTTAYWSSHWFGATRLP